MFVNGDLLNQIAALYAHFLLGQEMVDDDVGHVFAEGVALLVQAVNSSEEQLVATNRAVLAADSLQFSKRNSFNFSRVRST